MNKIFTFLATTLFSLSLFKCSFDSSNYDVKESGKAKEFYDVSENVERSMYLGQEITTDEVNVKVYTRSFFGPTYLYINFEQKLLSVNRYDVVDVFLCDLNGENQIPLLLSPVTCDFTDSSKMKRINKNVEDYLRKHSDNDFELRIITEYTNITCHMWDAPDDILPNGRRIDSYDVSNNQTINAFITDTYQDGQDRLHLSVKKYDGKWIGNKIALSAWGYESLDLVQVYLTDKRGDDSRSLVWTPISLMEEKNNVTIYFDDAPQNYYDIHDNYVLMHFIFANFNLVLRTWEYEYLYDYEASEFDTTFFDTSKNVTLSLDYSEHYESVSFGNFGKISFIDNKNNTITLYLNNKTDTTFTIVNLYFCDGEDDNMSLILLQPILCYPKSSGNFEFTFSCLENFRDYFIEYNDEVYCVVVLEGVTVKYRLDVDSYSKPKPNGKSISDYNDDISANPTNYAYLSKDSTTEINYKINGYYDLYCRKFNICGITRGYEIGLTNYRIEFDYVEIYITDSKNEHRFDLITEPITTTEGVYVTTLLLRGPSQTYYRDYGDDVIVHIITKYGTVNACFWVNND